MIVVFTRVKPLQNQYRYELIHKQRTIPTRAPSKDIPIGRLRLPEQSLPLEHGSADYLREACRTPSTARRDICAREHHSVEYRAHYYHFPLSCFLPSGPLSASLPRSGLREPGGSAAGAPPPPCLLPPPRALPASAGLCPSPGPYLIALSAPTQHCRPACLAAAASDMALSQGSFAALAVSLHRPGFASLTLGLNLTRSFFGTKTASCEPEKNCGFRTLFCLCSRLSQEAAKPQASS